MSPNFVLSSTWDSSYQAWAFLLVDSNNFTNKCFVEELKAREGQVVLLFTVSSYLSPGLRAWKRARSISSFLRRGKRVKKESNGAKRKWTRSRFEEILFFGWFKVFAIFLRTWLKRKIGLSSCSFSWLWKSNWVKVSLVIGSSLKSLSLSPALKASESLVGKSNFVQESTSTRSVS